MANEITNAAGVSNGGRVAEVLSGFMHQNKYDPTDLRPFMRYVPWKAAAGSATMSIPKLPAPAAAAAASSETSGGFSNTAFTTGEAQLTVALRGLQYQLTDLLQLTAPGGGAGQDIETLAQSLQLSIGLDYTDLGCGLFSSVSANVGTTEVDMSVDDFYDAHFTLLIANARGQKVAVLHPRQFADLQESARSESGAAQFRSDTSSLLNAAQVGGGVTADFLGVRIVAADSVATANAGEDRQGCMWVEGAIAYSFAPAMLIQPNLDPSEIYRGIISDDFFIERVRDGANSMTTLMAKHYPAVTLVEDGLAVTITTDA